MKLAILFAFICGLTVFTTACPLNEVDEWPKDYTITIDGKTTNCDDIIWGEFGDGRQFKICLPNKRTKGYHDSLMTINGKQVTVNSSSRTTGVYVHYAEVHTSEGVLALDLKDLTGFWGDKPIRWVKKIG